MRSLRRRRTPEDLRETEDLVRAKRPEADSELLDRVHASVSVHADAGARKPSAPLRTRVAITGLLAFGVIISGTGGALALSGSSGSGSVGAAQYPPSTTTTTTPTGDVLGPPPETSTLPPPTTPTDETDIPPITEPPVTISEEDVLREAEPLRQAEATSRERELPFTGLAAIPVIIAGLVLMGAGLLLRRGSATTPGTRS